MSEERKHYMELTVSNLQQFRNHLTWIKLKKHGIRISDVNPFWSKSIQNHLKKIREANTPI